MIVTIRDYADNARTVDIGDIDRVLAAHINILTGDEILNVIYENPDDIASFDSDKSHTRMNNYDDGSYPVYSKGLGFNLLSDPDWNILTDSYQRQRYAMRKLAERSRNEISA